MQWPGKKNCTPHTGVCPAALAAAMLLLAACASLPRPEVPDVTERRSVALLPLQNDTNDVDGPAVVRDKMAKALADRGVAVRDLGAADAVLRDGFGVTIGGQAEGVDPQRLGEALNVDALLFGVLMDFQETTLGAYNVRKVRARFRLVSASTGSVIWERGLGVRSELVMAGRAGDAATALGRLSDPRDADAPWVTIEHIEAGRNVQESLALGLGSRLLTRALGIHLAREAAALARMIAGDFPPVPAAPQAGPDSP